MIENAKGIPEFDEHGNLPRKCYEVTLREIKEYFVDKFPYSETRKTRFDCFINFYKELLKSVKSCIRILIDGSFVENKCNPNDIDFVIVIDSKKYNDFEKVYLETEFQFKDVLREEFKSLKKQGRLDEIPDCDFYKYGCDFFPLIVEEKDSFDYPAYLSLKKYWIRQWSHDREKNEKGFLNLKVNYEEDFDGI